MRTLAFFSLVTLLFFGSSGAQTTIRPAHPTHYFYTPAPYVNEAYALVLSLHEISYALPYNLQIQASLLDNIGRINFGAKYGFRRNLSVGAGLAHTIAHLGRGSHGIPEGAQPRFGAFLVYGILLRSNLEIAITPHTQIGNHFSAGLDFGLYGKPNPIWGVIWEVGSSVDLTDEKLYLNTDLGLRITPPQIPFLHFDIGIDLEETNVTDGHSPTVTAFFDVIFGMMTN
ncbi:MAG: hypothetical protein ACOC41_03025 [Chitinivibrionales bacterium]